MPVLARWLFAFVAFFRILFDGRFAARARQLAEGRPPPEQLLPPEGLRAEPPPEPPAAPSTDAALQLLALLQREGRLVDFLQQEIEAFPDADIGAAARVVHAGCRKALASHVDVEPIRTEPEGTPVTLEAGFDATRVKLTGNVGAAPYRGTLRHRGWRARGIHLPEIVPGHDVTILAPAEVEI
jgi:hypothetical protein